MAGRLAVQLARKLGAGRVVATGRREQAIKVVAALGADITINTSASVGEVVSAFRAHLEDGYNIVLDFLWGLPTELLLQALMTEELGFARETRIIQVGDSAGEEFTLPGSTIRTSGVEMVGATKGLTPELMTQAYEQAVAWARDGEIKFHIENSPLKDIATAWERPDLQGKRLVAVIEQYCQLYSSTDRKSPAGRNWSNLLEPDEGSQALRVRVSLGQWFRASDTRRVRLGIV